VALERDSVSLTVGEEGTPLSLALSEVAALEVRVGRKSAIFEGLGIGYGLGMIVGGLATRGQCAEEQGSFADYCIPSGLYYGALIGAALGGAIGAMIQRDRWAPVSVTPLRQPTGAVRASGPR
jgi:hypothetical protein